MSSAQSSASDTGPNTGPDTGPPPGSRSAVQTPREPGRLVRALERFASGREDRDARELRTSCVDVGATPLAQVADRTRATVAGTLRTVTLRPVGGVPALEAELYDGSGVVTLVWLGRRRLAAIEPGRWLLASGLVADHDGRRLMYNPRYELRAAGPG